MALIAVLLIQQQVVTEARKDERRKVAAEYERAGLQSSHSPNSLYIMVTSMNVHPLSPAVVPGSEISAFATLILRDPGVSAVLLTRGTKENNFRVAFEPVDPNNYGLFEFNDTWQAKK